MELKRLKKVELRKAWAHEATDFTTWLSQNENLELLSDEIGLGIKLLQTEASVGRFNVDILAEEENTGRKIVIENQLEITNHDHLGKIITYASGLDAEIIIWIVKDVRDEHKQAVDWLNEHTDEKIYIFVIKMELWQIGNSDTAPKFQIISKPNDWAKSLKSNTGGQLTETKVMQLAFWDKFKEFVQDKKSILRLRKPRPQHWYDISIGNSNAHISLTLHSQNGKIGCEIYINHDQELYSALEKYKTDIEKELNDKLIWMPLEGKKATRIRLLTDADLYKTGDWEEYFEWLKSEAELFQKIFSKYIKKTKKH
ncbi:DUF4268 domain-containing protein [Candidatus Peregrinibacteria bacterium]|jgi:hypothetical protein|nr:DUF4268 domain-containing protein [Candidatus Peregrinibacteria bacterium]MBT4148221.1 DUF4268 domain-containing protein [Candidatus Peregrinibacteria bacterium]MBT4455985.1 DUF4268 domain-containing protein [Candidatus Peregrinibacteria bacterium]MBT6052931.1 DUF4268 domain-containing protein [Candidatus Scalindua sp.]